MSRSRVPRTVSATEGIGQLVIDVPANVTVDLRTHVGIGTVDNYTEDNGFIQPGAVIHKTGANLVLNLQVGIGHIQIVHISGTQR